MPSCENCGAFLKKNLLLHLRKNPVCNAAMKKCLAVNIPNVVELLPQRTTTESSHGTLVFQEKSWVEKQSAPVQAINESSTGKHRSNRTRVVVHKPIGFCDKSSSAKNVSMNDVFMNDMSTVGMDSINPVENDYWC